METTFIDCPIELQDYALSGYDYTTEATFWTTDKTLKVGLESYLQSEDVTQGLPYESILVVGDSEKHPKHRTQIRDLRRVAKTRKYSIPTFWDDDGWYKLVRNLANVGNIPLPRPLSLELASSKNVSDILSVLAKLSGLGEDEITLDLIREIRGFDYTDFSEQIVRMINGESITVPNPTPFLYYANKRLDAYLRVRLGCFEGNKYQIKYLIKESAAVSTARLRSMSKQLSLAVGRVEVSGFPSSDFFVNLVDTNQN